MPGWPLRPGTFFACGATQAPPSHKHTLTSYGSMNGSLRGLPSNCTDLVQYRTDLGILSGAARFIAS